MAQSTLNAAILGASGYTGADLVRLALQHPKLRIAALGADSKAGRSIAETFPHLSFADLPILQKPDDIDWANIDVAFGCLPHGASESVLSQLPERIRIEGGFAEVSEKGLTILAEKLEPVTTH